MEQFINQFIVLSSMKRLKIILLLVFSPSLFFPSNTFSKFLVVHSSMFPHNRNEAISELEEKLNFYNEIGIDNLYVFNTAAISTKALGFPEGCSEDRSSKGN